MAIPLITNFNPWGPDQSGGLATFREIGRKEEQDALKRRQVEQDMSQQQMSMDEMSRKQQMRDKMISEVQNVNADQGLGALDKQRRLNDVRQSVDPLGEVSKEFDLTSRLSAEQKAKVDAYAMGALTIVALKAQKQSPEQILQNPALLKLSKDSGIPVKELLAFGDKSAPAGPSALVMDVGNDMKVLVDIGSGSPKTSVIQKKQGMTAEEYELARRRLALQEGDLSRKTRQIDRSTDLREKGMDPYFKSEQKIAETVGKDMPKQQEAARIAKINIAKLDKLEKDIPQLGEGFRTQIKNYVSRITGEDYGTAEGQQIILGILGQARKTLGLLGATSDKDVDIMNRWASGGYTEAGLRQMISELRAAEQETIDLYSERKKAMPGLTKYVEGESDPLTEIERIRATLEPGKTAKVTIGGAEYTIYKPTGNEAKRPAGKLVPPPVSSELYNAAKAKGYKGTAEQFRKDYGAAKQRKGGK